MPALEPCIAVGRGEAATPCLLSPPPALLLLLLPLALPVLQAALAAGARGACLSGAGSSIIAFTTGRRWGASVRWGGRGDVETSRRQLGGTGTMQQWWHRACPLLSPLPACRGDVYSQRPAERNDVQVWPVAARMRGGEE